MARTRRINKGRPFVFTKLKPEGAKDIYKVTIENEGQGAVLALKQAKAKLVAHVENQRAVDAAVALIGPAPELILPEPINPPVEVAPAPTPVAPLPVAEPSEFNPTEAASIATNLAVLLDKQREQSEALKADLALAQSLRNEAVAAAAAAEESRLAAIKVAENSQQMVSGAVAAANKRTTDLIARVNELDSTVGQLNTDAGNNKELINRAGSLIGESREEIASLAASSFQRMAEEVRLDVSIVAGAVGADQSMVDLYLNKVRQDPTLGSKLFITESDRAQLRAAMAGQVEADRQSDLSSHTAADLAGGAGGTVGQDR